MSILSSMGQALNSPDVIGLIIMVLANFVLGVFAAIRTGTFDWDCLMEFVYTDGPILGAYIFVVALGSVAPESQLAVLLSVKVAIGGPYSLQVGRSIWKSVAEIIKPVIDNA